MAPAASTQSRARTSHRSGFAEIVCYLCNLSSDGHRGIAFGFFFVLFFVVLVLFAQRCNTTLSEYRALLESKEIDSATGHDHKAEPVLVESAQGTF